MNNLCAFLDWDTKFFGYRVARVPEHRMNPILWSKIEEWCVQNTIDLLYFLADFNDTETTRTIENAGFRLVDIRVEFETHTLGGRVWEGDNRFALTHAGLREALPTDIAVLQEISKGIYKDSRFYYDSKLSTFADSFYQTWIRNSCEGFADKVFVATESSQCVGYITAHLDGKENGHIGLIGVRQDRQGLGVGQSLVGHCLDFYRKNDIRRITVVSQGRNVQALRFYQRCGFLMTSIRLWYHKWF